MHRRWKSFLSLSLLLTACATTLPKRIEQAAVPELRNAIWGIEVQDDAGRVLYARNAHTLLMPASNRKLFAASTAINCFGLDDRFATELWVDGRSVVIRGTGDPTLGGRWAFTRDAVFMTFVDALRAKGVQSVDDVIADVSAFDRVTIPGSWKYGNLGSDYAAPVDALAYNENVVGVVVENCEHPLVMTDPSFVLATAHVACGDGEIAIHADASNALTIDGAMSGNVSRLVAVADPALYAAQAFRDALRHAGIEVRGTARVNVASHVWQERVAVIESPPLFLILTTMLTVSQNLYAEMLFKATAGAYGRAADLEREFLTHEVGIDGREFRFVDGCGLAPDDLVTPSAIVTLLRWMNAPQRRGIFWSILAAPGQEGTLRRRLLPLAARFRGKTGTIAGVNALSGILAGTHGGYRYFSIVLNHHIAESSIATRAIDAMVNAIADF